jgi:hypothetical protein
LALLALGLPLDQTEHLTGLKSETIRHALMSGFDNRECWAAIRERLLELGIIEREIHCLCSVARNARLKHRCSPGFGRYLRFYNRPRLKARIERVIGAEVLMAHTRQGLGVCKKEELIQLLKRIRQLPIAEVKSAASLLERELMVLRQLHTPNKDAHFFAIMDCREHEIDLATRKVPPPPMTLESLAMGLGMNFEEFLAAVVKIVRKLKMRKLSVQGQN